MHLPRLRGRVRALLRNKGLLLRLGRTLLILALMLLVAAVSLLRVPALLLLAVAAVAAVRLLLTVSAIAAVLLLLAIALVPLARAARLTLLPLVLTGDERVTARPERRGARVEVAGAGVHRGAFCDVCGCEIDV